MKTTGRLVNALAIDAITAAVPARAAVISPDALRLAAAADALALLAIPVNPLATIRPKLP